MFGHFADIFIHRELDIHEKFYQWRRCLGMYNIKELEVKNISHHLHNKIVTHQ